MQDLVSFYRNQSERHSQEESKLKKLLAVSSTLRLLVFLLTGLGLYFFFEHTKITFAIAISGIVLFLYLVSRHSDLKYQHRKENALKEMNKVEIQILDRDFHHRPDGSEYKDPLHHFSQDIDMFGRGSFYQYLNRTVLQKGSETLAGILVANKIDNILKKQKAIAELSKKPEWRQEFSAIASLVKAHTSTQKIQNWLQNYTSFVPVVMKNLPLVFSLISIVSLTLYFLDFLHGFALILQLILGFLISAFYTKKITRLADMGSKMQSTFEQYNRLIKIIEDANFDAELLADKQDVIRGKGKKTSEILREFSKLLGNLDQNNNVFYLIFGNGFFLRGLATSYQIESWITTHGSFVGKWFETVAYFDAYISLGTFAFNHPDYVFPVLTASNDVLNSKAAGHPLLSPEKCVLNDFRIESEQFFIITGANMAGKSTFLRTVSLQLVMANIGLPIFAKEATCNPIKLITSMRTTDSLTDEESYFFSELKRLKFIVDEIQNDRYFIVLDEILKGTNSTDKAKGSREFIEKLAASKSTGLIATHDLTLCETANENRQIENYYFDAEIIDDELHFDYKFKAGICQNMNASFLLKKMGIVDL